MHTRKAPDFWGLHKNMNCEVPLRTNFYRTPPRSSHQRCSMKKGVLRNFTKFTGKHLCQTLFFSKVAGFRPATFLKRGSGTSVFL